MDAVPVRLLNQDTAGVLARVAQGESLEITSRGRPVARLVPVTDPTSPAIAALIAAGRLIPPSVRAPILAPDGPPYEGEDAGALLSRMRDEERW